MKTAHLRRRTNTAGAVARIRNALACASHRFFKVRLHPSTLLVDTSVGRRQHPL